MALLHGSYLRLLMVLFACVTLPGCSIIRHVLFINRFHENIQVEINETAEKTRVPTNGYAFSEGGRYTIPFGINGSIYTENGKLIRKVTFSYDGSQDVYQDRLIVIEVGP